MVQQEPLILRFDPPPPKRPPEVVHADAMARGARCRVVDADGKVSQCPLYGCDRGPVLGTIQPGAPLIAIGEAPGENEVKEERGFVGASGRVLDQALLEGGLHRSQVSVTNTILCQPEGGNFSEYIEGLKAAHRRALKKWQRQYLEPGDAKLTPARRDTLIMERYEAARAKDPLGLVTDVSPPPVLILPEDACRPRLERDLEESKSLVTLAVGRQALESVRSIMGLASTKDKDPAPDKVKVANIKKQHGAPVLLPDGRVLMATYHPAFAMRDKKEYMPVIRENIARAARIAQRNGRIDWAEPEYILSPTPEQITLVLNMYLEHRAEVTVDIETDGIDPHAARIRCVGVGAQVDGKEVLTCIPFNHMDGMPWWDEATKVRIALLFRKVLDECPLIFQNGQFDTTALLRVGLMTNRAKTWSDTLIGHHDTPDNDLPHDLGFITRRYFEVPLWKESVDHKTVSGTSDYYLHLYCLRDVLATMRAMQPIRRLIIEYGTETQYATDIKMAPAVRDMSELGMACNEWRRGQYSTHFNKQCIQLAQEFGKAVGRTINPRSPKQLQDLFYVDWGYKPCVATDGYEWEEEEDELEDGSTSNAALTRLQADRIGDKKHPHWKAIDKLLAFRANDKIRGTYTDNVKTYEVDWDSFGFTGPYSVGWADPVTAVVYDEILDKDVERVVLPRRRGLSLVRSTFKNFVVPTGRLASGDPINFQNVPTSTRGGLNLRNMYFAPPRHRLVGADYAQIEARLYAVIAQDQLLLEAIHKGLDIHSLNAASLLAKPWEHVMDVYKRVKSMPKDEMKHIRTVAKRFCFGLIYGAGWQKLYQVMGADRKKDTGELTFEGLLEKDCKEWEENWHRLHPETKRWHEHCHAAFVEYGYTGVPMLDYRKRFFPGGVAQENAIPNLTIQGSAASIANRALLMIAERIPHRGWSYFSGLCLQVHDQIVVCVPEDRDQEALRIINECMPFTFRGMHFPIDPAISWSWGDQ